MRKFSAKIKNRPRRKEMKEYRWEFEKIGQGHYFLDLLNCLRDAEFMSTIKPDLTIMVEQFRPERKKLAVLKAGQVIKEFIC